MDVHMQEDIEPVIHRTNASSTRKRLPLNEQELIKSRDKWISQRQKDMDQILDVHDTLVREHFHLEKFVTMVAYDPEEAKADKSAVFEQYKAERFDLLSQTSNTRTTRHTINARMRDLKGSQSISPQRSARVSKTPNFSHSNNIWSIISEAKGKGKQRATEAQVPTSVSSPVNPLNSPRKISEADIDYGTPNQHSSFSLGDSVLMNGRIPKPRKKRKIRPKLDEPSGRLSAYSKSTSRGENDVIEYKSIKPSHVRRDVQHFNAPSTKKKVQLKVKRLKLIVRTPPPLISHSKHILAPTQFGGSLTMFLNSYNALDSDDLSVSTLHKMASHDAEVLNHLERLKQSGRLLPQFEPEFDSTIAEQNGASGTARGRDVWDIIVSDVKERYKRRFTSAQGAAHAAKCIRENQKELANASDRAHAAEEKRLRALAKATMKLVSDEWKKAVFHLREQARLKEEAEERKLGRFQLDAILDRSGMILESQQLDMTRGEASRSHASDSSMSVDDSDQESDDTDISDDSSPVSFDVTDSMVVDAEAPDDAQLGNQNQNVEVAIGDMIVADVDPLVDLHTRNEATESTLMDSMVFQGQNHSVEDNDSTPLKSHDHSTLSHQTRSITPSDNGLVAIELDKGYDRENTADCDGDEAFGHEKSFDLGSRDSEDGDVVSRKSNDMISENTAQVTSTMAHSLSGDDMESSAAQAVVSIPQHLKPYAVAPVQWNPENKVQPPVLLRGTLRPYQQAGLEWLASLHTNYLNGILADEMGLGKTIQTIALLAHLACDRGIWGPHLIIVPTSVLLNWEMEFKKFLPGFRTLSYHGSTKRRKELRQGWNDKYRFNVCITSYTLASRDAHIFKRKNFYYLICDEAHMIKSWKSQRWNILIMFRSFRRLLLTGTPLQNNLTELWALLQFLMAGTDFVNLKEFGDWFSNPLERAIEMGTMLDDDNMARVSKLHTVLRPYLLRRLKKNVEKELPSKYEHLVLCPLSKRQRFLYDEFMHHAQTKESLSSGVYQKIANILMQLRKVCNHPDLFEVRPIKTSFAMSRSAVADFEIKELLIRRRLIGSTTPEDSIDLQCLGLKFVNYQGRTSLIEAIETRRLDASHLLLQQNEDMADAPPVDLRSIAGYRRYIHHHDQMAALVRSRSLAHINRARCTRCCAVLLFSSDLISSVRKLTSDSPFASTSTPYFERETVLKDCVKLYSHRALMMKPYIDRFAFVTPAVVALDMPQLMVKEATTIELFDQLQLASDIEFDALLHPTAVKLQIAFPDSSLIQFDCGKLQHLAALLHERHQGGHRALIFTQMTKILDILEIFLNLHGWRYLRLDGSTKIEDRQYLTERFNTDDKIFCFISSSRSGGVGINLTGADTVIFYDSDFNPQMDRQCEDRAHRIGQVRDVHIYRFISSHTVEEAMLLKANQKRSLDDVVIQKGAFDWQSLFGSQNQSGLSDLKLDDGALRMAMANVEDVVDRDAALYAAREENILDGADQADFGDETVGAEAEAIGARMDTTKNHVAIPGSEAELSDVDAAEVEDELEEAGGIVDYMLAYIQRDEAFFEDWRL